MWIPLHVWRNHSLGRLGACVASFSTMGSNCSVRQAPSKWLAGAAAISLSQQTWRGMKGEKRENMYLRSKLLPLKLTGNPISVSLDLATFWSLLGVRHNPWMHPRSPTSGFSWKRCAFGVGNHFPCANSMACEFDGSRHDLGPTNHLG